LCVSSFGQKYAKFVLTEVVQIFSTKRKPSNPRESSSAPSAPVRFSIASAAISNIHTSAEEKEFWQENALNADASRSCFVDIDEFWRYSMDDDLGSDTCKGKFAERKGNGRRP